MCWKADRSVRAFPHVHSSCPGIAAQLGALVNLCSFYSLGLTLLFYCRSGIMLILTSLKAMPASAFSRGRIRCWWPFVGLKAQTRQHLRPALQGSKGMVVRRPMPGQTVSLYTRCFTTSALFHISLLAAFLLLFNTVSSSLSSSLRLLWMLNMPVISGTPVSEVCFSRKRDLQQ